MIDIRIIKNSIILSLLIIYLVIYRLYILKNQLGYVGFSTAAFLIIVAFIAIWFYGYRKDKKNILKKKIISLTTIEVILFFTISYGIGLLVGFLRNSYSLKPAAIINNIFAPIAIIIAIELLRYVFLMGNEKNKKSICLFTIILIIFEILTNFKSVNIYDLEALFKLFTTIILPITIKSSVFSYITLNSGYRPALIYRLIMDIYVYVMPIIPNLGDYITSMIGVCMPFILYLYTLRIVNEYYNGVEYVFERSSFRITDIPVLAFITVLICLISGYFPHFMLGIATISMTPKINKGDAIIAHKIKKPDELEIGQVIVYTNSKKNIVHRIVDIEKRDNKTYYITQGDANPTKDNVDLEFKDIKGIVDFKIPVIAYPSIYFSEKLKTGV